MDRARPIALSLILFLAPSLAVLADDDIQYTARVATHRVMSVTINVGTRFPAYATSMGRVQLAALPEDELAAYLARADLRRLSR